MLALLLLLSPPAFSLENEWLALWRRIEDRHGRPDSDGSLLQWAADPQYLEYVFDQAQASFPLSGEAAWQAADRGARLYVQSITEFAFTNVVELKTTWPVGAGVSVGVRYHQLEDRHTRSRLARLVVSGREVAETPLLFELHVFPRWEKEDLDIEAMVGVGFAHLGEARARVFALDPVVNASYALAESRGAELSEVLHQEDAPLAFALELASVRWWGLRGELYAGTVLPAATEHTTPDDPAATFTHRQSGWLLGGLLEWAGPLTIGATALHVAADDTWQGANPRQAQETRTEARLYGLADLPGSARIESQAHVFLRDFSGSPPTLGETRVLYSLRGFWPTEGTVGAELGLLRTDRWPRGDVPAWVDVDAAHRLTTRVTLHFPPHVWCALGVGWDLDGGDGRYDGGGLTVILTE